METLNEIKRQKKENVDVFCELSVLALTAVSSFI